MSTLFETIAHDHDLRFVALAIGICALGSLTAVAIARHAFKPETAAYRTRWLVLAGLVTGLAVWTTHFTAMLGYRNDLDIRFDLSTVSISFLLAVPMAMAGWVLGFRNRERSLVAGVLIGFSIAAAHFVDISALRVPGTVQHDHSVSLIAILCGIGLVCLSTWIFKFFRKETFAWPATLPLFLAVLSLHFIAMSGVSITSESSSTAIVEGTATPDQLATVVVAAFMLLLAAAIAFTLHSESLARATAEKQKRLIHALEDLRRSRDHHQAYVELNPQIAWVADTEGRVTEIAPLWEELVGIPRHEGTGEGWSRPVHPDDLPRVYKLWQEAVTSGDGSRADVRYRIRLCDGSYRWFRARARPRHDEAGNVVAWYGSLEDIHEQVLAENALRCSEERYRLASRATNDVIWDWSLDEQRATWAGAHKKVLGYPELHSGTNLDWWRDRIHPEDLPRVCASQAAALEGSAEYWSEEYRFLIASGEWIDVKSRCVIVRADCGRAYRLVGSMLDITQQKKAEAELSWAAHHDPLSRLPNRALFRARLDAAIESARAGGRFVGLVTLDLNDFKGLNDRLGHAAGDSLLEETAQRLVKSVPINATVARMGGDEFSIILPDLETIHDYAAVTAVLANNLKASTAIGGMQVPISFCAGVSIWPRDGHEPGELLVAADLALYAAKGDLPGTIKEFVPSLRAKSEVRSRMLDTARVALEAGRIIPFYQPKIDLQTGEVMGWEALLRVQTLDGLLLSPAQIEAAFADTDLSVQLTDRMLERVFHDIAEWRSSGMDPGRIAVNVSAGDFRLQGLACRLRKHARVTGQRLANIDIEVTEGVLIGQLGPEVSRMLEELRAMGVMVALDDFGTGYASLTHLQQFPVDVIKIDKSFVDKLQVADAKATAVVDAVLQMAKRLNMQTVAEGVETRAQARYLRARGCTIGQGYFFSRPIAASAVGALMIAQPFQNWELADERAFPLSSRATA